MNALKRYPLLLVIPIVISFLMAVIPACTNPKAINMPIVLLTDFGSEDFRISQLKGIIYNNYREARTVDASHSIPAFDIATGAFMLDIAAREFPDNVTFVGVIAPYAQTETKYLVVTTGKNQFFVVPDNGLITYVIKSTGSKTIYRVTNQKLFDKPIKDLSAEHIEGKIGALIASGYAPKDVGEPFSNPKTLDIQQCGIENQKLVGTIVYIDHFGNAVTNITGKTANDFGIKPGDIVKINLPLNTISAKFGTIYSDVAQGKEIVFVNNNLGTVQLSINLGNFAATYGIKAGTRIEIGK